LLQLIDGKRLKNNHPPDVIDSRDFASLYPGISCLRDVLQNQTVAAESLIPCDLYELADKTKSPVAMRPGAFLSLYFYCSGFGEIIGQVGLGH
jgi:hypothetical protein